jgi:PAS domain S-box-containing protein
MTTVLYAGLDQRLLPAGALEHQAAYVGQAINLMAIAEDIFQLAPATTNIVVVIGVTPIEQFWGAELQREFAAVNPHATVTLLNDLSFEQMLDRVANLPPQSFILLGILVRDVTGVTHNQDLALKRLHACANAPIAGVWHHQLGLGIVGGRLYEAETVGVEAAGVAVRLLRGEPPEQIPPFTVSIGRPRYDHRELRRWKISERRLPPNSLVLFREPSLWEAYGREIIAALAIVFLQGILIVGLLLNLRRRRQAEQQLRESEARVNLAADSAGAGLWSLDPSTGQVWASPRLREIFQFAAAEPLTAESFVHRTHPADQPRLRHALDQALKQAGELSLEFRILLPGNSLRWVSARGQLAGQPRGRPRRLSGAAVDITDRKLSEERFQQIFETADNALVMINPAGQMVLVNSQTEKIFGYRREELLGQPIERLIPAQRTQFVQDPGAQRMGVGREFCGLRKDGTEVPVEIGLNPIHTSEDSFVLATIVDIADRQKNAAEMRRLRLQAWHADRVVRTGAITASLAHELNQPLAAILSNAQAALRFLERGPPDLHELRAILTDIVADDKRAGGVISGVRSMLRRQESPRTPVALAATIQETLDLLHSELVGQHIEAQLRPGEDLVALGDKPQIQQVLLNLVMNAAEALQDRPAGPRRIEVSLHRLEPDQAQISVRDTGPGIPDAAAGQLFEAFRTSKPTGLGVGLPICRSIVEAHGGRIWLANHQPGATTFRFTLPLAKSPAPPPTSLTNPESPGAQ